MPNRRSISSSLKLSQRTRHTFRERYDWLETHRTELVLRLHLLAGVFGQHAGYKRALKLLNEICRKEKLARRLAVL